MRKAPTTFRTGLLSDQKDAARDEMFIDPSPYLSLRGLGLHESAEKRAKSASKNPRAPTDLGRAAMNRSCGKPSGHAAQNDGNPPIHRGAPPHNTRDY